ncbi:GntR family transcriptional regulator [Levilactobacillus sp. HBUAS70063]|uniref:GntR family transcriptional regulator n=1 Tax=Levilactobacillus sp. HBUAS70063 TaxID=3109359 RepID=UPI003132F960
MESLQEKAYTTILTQIISLDLLPGQRVFDKDFEKQLDMSRTPVREALMQLTRNGLLHSVPQSGTYITKIDMQKALDARYARKVLEESIIAELCANIDPDDLFLLIQIINSQKRTILKMNSKRFFELDEKFHATIYLLADKTNLWKWLLTFNYDLNRFRALRLRDKDLSFDILVEEHIAIVHALKTGDAQQAVKLVGHHLDLMLSEKDEVLSKYPDYFISTRS